MDPEINRLRGMIDNIDLDILNLLNRRAACALRIGAIKRAEGRPIYDPLREGVIIGRAQDGSSGPLTREAVRRLYERILDESRSLERAVNSPRDRDSDSEGNDT